MKMQIGKTKKNEKMKKWGQVLLCRDGSQQDLTPSLHGTFSLCKAV
jgi:hypothetical protein